MFDCYAKKTVGGTELSGEGKVASSGKRKRNDDDDGNTGQEKPKETKKTKTAAVRQDEDEIMEDAQPRIWEIEQNDEESDF
jgi:hypothetical protein